MTTSACFAIHAIWTTYMTWPPGDARGHWSPLYDFYGRLIETGHKLNLSDRTNCEVALHRAKEPEKVLSPEEQRVVADTIGLSLSTFGSPVPIHAAAVERTHVHLFFGPTRVPIATLIGKLKGCTSSAVIAHGREPGRKRTWTSGYWKVFVFEYPVIPHVQAYIERHNERRG